MHASTFTPWYNAPARRFPAKVWLEDRFPFRIVTPLSARRQACSSAPAQQARRLFPAKIWLETCQASNGFQHS